MTTNRKALETICVRMACLKRAAGLEWDLEKEEWKTTGTRCNQDCEKCELGSTDVRDILDTYTLLVKKMTEEAYEEERRSVEWRGWQRECDPRQPMTI